MKRGAEATEAKTRQQLAKEFVDTWTQPDKGKEDADRQTFWNDLLHRVYGIVNYYDYVTYEKDVRVKDSMGKITTKRIDGYIPSTRTMIEQKGRGRALDKPEPQSDGVMLTPYEQAKRYANFLPNSELNFSVQQRHRSRHYFLLPDKVLKTIRHFLFEIKPV